MNKLIVLIGRPGAGKTYLSGKFIEKHPEFTSLDIYTYIKKIKDEVGKVPENKIIDAYKELYKNFENNRSNVILETGLNHPEFNLNEFKKLDNEYDVRVVWCMLDQKICLKRSMERAKQDKDRLFVDPKALERRIKRVFPDNHIKLADKIGLKHYSIDMLKSLEERINFLEKL